MLLLFLQNTWILPQIKVSTKFYWNIFPDDMIFTEEDVSTSDDQVEKLTR